ncbi:DUF930 domain-containing protein [Bradyrhizobium canariense]|uniref:DUF930 domain-containing protein n=1 Tax=Bradyrhizobium canariense TaxID=255045 RepID=UPI001F0B6704|nr:DUF930 domain-containing protein [Bradyrhizobium canariense]
MLQHGEGLPDCRNVSAIATRWAHFSLLQFPYLEPITVKSFLLLPVALAATTLVSSQAVGRTISDEQMMKLDLGARVEQRCNRRAMGLVGREHRGFHPDELVAYAYGDPRSSGAVVDASGAAVRSGNAWYHLAYSCQTSADGLKIEQFKYSLGGAIPKGDWAEHYLVAP